jgi:lipopolysaccharide export system protein LptA
MRMSAPVKGKWRRGIWLGALLVVVWSFPFPLSGMIDASGAGPPDSETVHIVSDRLEARQQQRQVIFSGHVVATQGDLTIKGDRMTIFYLEGGGDQTGTNDLGQKVDRIVVEGNVRILQRDRLATGGRAVYYRSENKVVLTGNPRIRRDKDFVQGQRITLFLDSEKSIVEGGPSKPVEATIYSPVPKDSVDRSKREGGGSSGVRPHGDG